MPTVVAFGFGVTKEGNTLGDTRMCHRGERTGGETGGEGVGGGVGVGPDWDTFTGDIDTSVLSFSI